MISITKHIFFSYWRGTENWRKCDDKR